MEDCIQPTCTKSDIYSRSRASGRSDGVSVPGLTEPEPVSDTSGLIGVFSLKWLLPQGVLASKTVQPGRTGANDYYLALTMLGASC